MTPENKCLDCFHCSKVNKGEAFRHRYGMIAVNFGEPFILRGCTTEKETSQNLDETCDRPTEFVANTEKLR